ncbi:MAG: hypothetical protein PHS44_02855 [Candidatus Dojkabacteria bacterium]|nr:hypothetical protein [Candidatus Dojkabacteria bacterium]
MVGSGVYFWQQSILEKEKDSLGQVKDSLEREKRSLEEDIVSLEEDILSYKKMYCKGTWQDGVCLLSTCIDSDVNEKPYEIYIKGSVTYTDKNGVATTVYDECTGSKLQVNEMWCYESPAGSGNYVQGKMIYDCPNECLDGACIK